jgi:hypothetical protein
MIDERLHFVDKMDLDLASLLIPSKGQKQSGLE